VIDRRDRVKGAGDNVAVTGQADVEIRGELFNLGGNRGLVAAAARRSSGQSLDVAPLAGEADEPGRQDYADRRVRRDRVEGVDADGRDPYGFQIMFG
jgi:hypothetical protein